MGVRVRRDTGATAVEFALLFPAFIVAVVGTITFGMAFNDWMGLTASARETSRYAATYSVNAEPFNGDVNAWLAGMRDQAARGAGIDLATDPTSSYFICVRFVNTESATPATTRATWGTLSTPRVDGTCTGSSMPTSRVEVAVRKTAPLNWLLGVTGITLSGQNTAKYEPSEP